MKKYPISFRLTEIAQRLIDELAEHLGLPKTGVVEIAIRGLAQYEGLYDTKNTESVQDQTQGQ